MIRLRLEGELSAHGAARALSRRPGVSWLDGDGGPGEGRWSFVASDPVEWRRCSLAEASPLSALSGLDGDEHTSGPGVPRWIGYVSYDAGLPRELRERRPANAVAVCFARYDAVLRIDGASGDAVIVADDEHAARRLELRLRSEAAEDHFEITGVEATSRRRHAEAIEVALSEIAAGEIYQVNLARRWRGKLRGRAFDLFCAMRRASPVPFGFYLDAGDHRVLGRSMERYLGWERASRRLWCRPIKGTLARGGDDVGEAARLRDDTKERAEHSMIVDLVRNDLGRVAEVGSVNVEDLYTVEPYAGLSHLVSTVRCRSRADVALRDVFEATFPPGSVTGTPKLRSLRTIEREEGFARGVYTGATGYISRSGDAHFAVAIRTAVERGGELTYDAGGGIVALSDPEREVDETELKARAFLDAL